MTSVAGYTILSTPCCGARYKGLAYSSINLKDRQTWSDGFSLAPLYRQSFSVCKCMACGTLFMTQDGVKVDDVPFDDDRSKALRAELPGPPTMTPDGVVSAVLASSSDSWPNGEIELSLRLAFWHQLNHSFRVLHSKSGYLPGLRGAGARQDHQQKNDSEAVFARLQQQISNRLPWDELSDADIDALIEDNLRRVLPLLKEFEPDEHLLFGEAHRALGQMDQAIARFQQVTGPHRAEAEHLIKRALAGERRVIRLEPPDWVEPPRKATPWVNPRPRGTVVALQSREYWYKIFGMLQQGWALVESEPDGEGVMLHKVQDDSQIYGQQRFVDMASAETFLLFSGYRRFDENPDVWSILTPPGGPFHIGQGVAGKVSPRRRVKDT